MGIEDEETRAVKAVKRKVTEVQTRKVPAVKRAPKKVAPDPWSDFLALKQADVLRRGSLLNEAGEKDEGWVFREPFDETDVLWFAWRAEAALTTLARWMDERGASFDVMSGGRCVAVLEFQRLKCDRDGHALLRSQQGTPLASLELRSHPHSVECFAEARSILSLEQSHPTQARLRAGRRSIGALFRRPQAGILVTTYDLEVSFDKQATGFERLCGAAMIVLQDAWRMAPRENDERRRRSIWD